MLTVCGISTLIQVLRVGRIGSGYILLMATSGAFIGICISALRAGGPSLLASLVVISSLVPARTIATAVVDARVFTPTVTGTVIMMIAATNDAGGLEMLETPDGYSDQAVQASTVATLIGFLLVALRGPAPGVYGPRQ